jgi:hypothetical protein
MRLTCVAGSSNQDLEGTMKRLKLTLLVVGVLFLIAAFVVYVLRIISCYPAANTYAQFGADQVKTFREACKLDSPLTAQFNNFLLLFVPGITLFTAYWMLTGPRVRNRRVGPLSGFLLVLMVDSLLVMLYGLLGYPAPGVASAPAAWAAEAIAALGFLCYVASVALWHWKRWGLALFQSASIALAAFILIGGGSLILAAVIIGGVIILSLLLRPVRIKLA